MRAAISAIGSIASTGLPVKASNWVNFPVPAPSSMMRSAAGKPASNATGYSGRPLSYSATRLA